MHQIFPTLAQQNIFRYRPRASRFGERWHFFYKKWNEN